MLIEIATIKVLPDNLINQIAAGEVVERPASIVKELVENCVDAKATRVEVFLEGGGIDSIRVTDNGCGMNVADLRLCSVRHATSKITQEKDLEAISTFGFRGEALSSIAVISEMEIKSRVANSEVGYSLGICFGQVQQEFRPVGCAPGTSITVRKLFQNVPARKKFLRTSATELSHCTKILKEIALGNPGVTFLLHHERRQLHQWKSQTRSARVTECLRLDLDMRVLEQADGVRLEAHLTAPHRTQERGEIFLFINQRCIRNRWLMSAVRNAYSLALGPHHDPSGVIYLDIRNDWVDANVHPQKLEVRLLKQENLYQWILSTIRKEVSHSHSISRLEFKHAPMKASDAAVGVEIVPEPVSDAPVSEPVSDKTGRDAIVSEPVVEYHLSPASRLSDHPAFVHKSALRTQSSEPLLFPTDRRPEALRYLGQVKASYLLWEDTEGVILIDQHALHEKLVYEKLKDQHKEGTLKAQIRLVAKMIRIPVEQVSVLEEMKTQLYYLGFDVENFGSGDVAVKSWPDLLGEEHVEKVLCECLKDLQRLGKTTLEQALHPVFATLACHSVIRAGQKLSEHEALALLEGLEHIESGWTCPHGRPVILRLPFSTIEKQFQRQ